MGDLYCESLDSKQSWVSKLERDCFYLWTFQEEKEQKFATLIWKVRINFLVFPIKTSLSWELLCWIDLISISTLGTFKFYAESAWSLDFRYVWCWYPRFMYSQLWSPIKILYFPSYIVFKCVVSVVYLVSICRQYTGRLTQEWIVLQGHISAIRLEQSCLVFNQTRHILIYIQL